MSGFMGTALSGLKVFQRSLEVTSHNIANVGTEGYSRQRVESGTTPAEFSGAGYIGTGVEINNITRSYDQFISGQLRSSTTTLGEAESFKDYAAQVDNLLADPSTGLEPAIQSFFDSAHDVATDPSSSSARDVMVLEGNAMTTRFSVITQRFDELRSQLNSDLRGTTDEINSYTSSIADLNLRISAASASSNGLPNDLLDERDVVLNKLSELIDISVIPQTSGMVGVVVRNGLPLVMDQFASTVGVELNEFDATKLDLTLQTNSGNPQVITDQITSGKVAGIFRFRDEILDPSQQKLGSIAAGIAMEFNAQHAVSLDLYNGLFDSTGSAVPSGDPNGGYDLNGDPVYVVGKYDIDGNLGGTGGYDVHGNAIGGGYDLEGNPGIDFFSFSGSTEMPAIASRNNAGNAVLTAIYNDVNLNPATLTDGSGNPNPASSSSADIDISDYLLQFDGTNYSLSRVEDGTSIPLTRDTTTVPNTLLPTNAGVDKLPGVTLQITGTPVGSATDSDEFLIRPTFEAARLIKVNITEGKQIAAAKNFNSDTGGIINGPMPGDNSNALVLSRLATNTDMFEGSLSYQDVYGGLVSNVGGISHIAKISAAAQNTLWEAANGAREGLGGVNLDEEAADLIKYQQAYQAAAQAISTASSLFDTLMGAVR